MIVPFPAGGGSDTFTRVIQKAIRDAELQRDEIESNAEEIKRDLEKLKIEKRRWRSSNQFLAMALMKSEKLH